MRSGPSRKQRVGLWWGGVSLKGIGGESEGVARAFGKRGLLVLPESLGDALGIEIVVLWKNLDRPGWVHCFREDGCAR